MPTASASAENPPLDILFQGEGKMRELLREIDWSETPLGPVSTWPRSLRLPVEICLNNRFPMCIWWGPELTMIYNDAFMFLCGKSHRTAAGKSARVFWASAWPTIEDQVNSVFERGESSWKERALIQTERNGTLEDSWFTFSFSPLKGETGEVEGAFLTTVEVTAHVQHERELIEARDQLIATLSSAEIGSWSLDVITGTAYADSSLAATFSISPEVAATGAPLHFFTDAIHVDDREKTIATITAALASGNYFEAEYRLNPKNGLINWVIARGHVFRDENGQAISMSGVLIDITRRKRAEELVTAQNEVLQLVVSDIPLPTILDELARHVERQGNGDVVVGILLLDDEGRLRHGAAPSLPDDYNQAVDGILIGEDVGTCGRAAYLNEMVVSPDLATDPNWAMLKDRVADLKLLSAWSQPILSVSGKVLGTFGTYFRQKREPTAAEKSTVDFLSKTAAIAIERSRIQEAIKQSEERFRQIADTLPQIVWGAQPDGIIDYYNRRWFEYINLPETDLEGARWDQFIHPEDFPATFENWIETLSSGENYQMEFRVRAADGNYHWFLTRALPIHDSQGKIVRWFGTCTDIHDRKLLQEENVQMIQRERAARVASEKAGRLKDDFLATLSHELRTPLNPVLLLASEAANNMNLPPEVRADFETIAKNVSLEAQLIDDLLDLTRITRGKMALSIGPVELHTVLNDAIGNVTAEISDKEIKLTTNFAAASGSVAGDPVRLQQVFWNILRNAAKFTPEGGSVDVTTTVTRDGKYIEVSVTDTGMGMSEDEVGRLFNAFTQGDHGGSTGSHRFGGLGLGLAISRMLVELHSGRIRGQSKGIGHGATFTVQIPLTAQPSPDKSNNNEVRLITPATSQKSRPTRVLLVEDHEPTRQALAQLLIRRHYDVVEAGSVGEAMTAAEARKFDLLITDIGLPDGDGYQLMRALGRSQNIKGIALTGYGMDADIERSRLAGFAIHLTKPIRVQPLDAALASVAALVSVD